MKNLLLTLMLVFTLWPAYSLDHPDATVPNAIPGSFPIISEGIPSPIIYDTNDLKGISIAVENLINDFQAVCGSKPIIATDIQHPYVIIIGSIDNPQIKALAQKGLIDLSQLKDKTEQYLITTVDQPYPGTQQALVITGSDRRGTIYGIYELSEQIGVSPWYWWADVPIQKKTDLHLRPGTYTAGEPAVRYRGLFLNDEAPCLTSWVNNYFGTNYGGKEFYAKVFELILRLRGNYLWPAMWGWAFYADDPENSKTADEMGVIMGTSHHEPMARNHQEYARHRDQYGPWNYATNQERLDKFFTEGIQRMKGTEDIVTIGMRGDGDEAMSREADVALLEKLIKNQRKIIAKETGRPASETPQLWTLYKEVLDYYDQGLKIPDDVILMFCDDNWGNVRRLPNEQERKHPGGWGIYYHVDYVGAPRNTKWINVTPIQNMWEQLSLTYEYGIDKLWILNVGDLKPMEYPITLFMDMAWNPTKYDAASLLEHTYKYCAQQFGEDAAYEAANILNLYSKYAGRVTPEMLDAQTYNINTEEWRQVRDELMTLETQALRQYISLSPEYKDAYMQLILFPVQALANLYDLYYNVAMNHKLYESGDPQCNKWGEAAKKSFERDAYLAHQYNHEMADGKWSGMMTQKHIGYTSWNDNFPQDIMPEVKYITNDSLGGYIIVANDGKAIIEAEHFFEAKDAEEATWTVIPYMGRTLSGVTLMPRLPATDGATLTYAIEMPDSVTEAEVHVIVKSTLAFNRQDGHRYSLGFEGEEPQIINFNHNLNEKPENIYSVFYPTVARRVVENTAKLKVPSGPGKKLLKLAPLDPGIVFEKIIVDFGGYTPEYLFGQESPFYR